jgi:hypothetical protein
MPTAIASIGATRMPPMSPFVVTMYSSPESDVCNKALHGTVDRAVQDPWE